MDDECPLLLIKETFIHEEAIDESWLQPCINNANKKIQLMEKGAKAKENANLAFND